MKKIFSAFFILFASHSIYSAQSVQFNAFISKLNYNISDSGGEVEPPQPPEPDTGFHKDYWVTKFSAPSLENNIDINQGFRVGDRIEFQIMFNKLSSGGENFFMTGSRQNNSPFKIGAFEWDNNWRWAIPAINDSFVLDGVTYTLPSDAPNVKVGHVYTVSFVVNENIRLYSFGGIKYREGQSATTGSFDGYIPYIKGTQYDNPFSWNFVKATDKKPTTKTVSPLGDMKKAEWIPLPKEFDLNEIVKPEPEKPTIPEKDPDMFFGQYQKAAKATCESYNGSYPQPVGGRPWYSKITSSNKGIAPDFCLVKSDFNHFHRECFEIDGIAYVVDSFCNDRSSGFSSPIPGTAPENFVPNPNPWPVNPNGVHEIGYGK